MVIWSGAGLVTLLMGVFGMLVGDAATSVFGELTPGAKLKISFGAAAAANFFFAQWRGYGDGRVLIDKETGHEIAVTKDDSLMFIPIKYWTIIYILVALFMNPNDLEK